MWRYCLTSVLLIVLTWLLVGNLRGRSKDNRDWKRSYLFAEAESWCARKPVLSLLRCPEYEAAYHEAGERVREAAASLDSILQKREEYLYLWKRETFKARWFVFSRELLVELGDPESIQELWRGLVEVYESNLKQRIMEARNLAVCACQAEDYRLDQWAKRRMDEWASVPERPGRTKSSAPTTWIAVNRPQMAKPPARLTQTLRDAVNSQPVISQSISTPTSISRKGGGMDIDLNAVRNSTNFRWLDSLRHRLTDEIRELNDEVRGLRREMDDAMHRQGQLRQKAWEITDPNASAQRLDELDTPWDVQQRCMVQIKPLEEKLAQKKRERDVVCARMDVLGSKGR